ncbi:MAG TPA: tRNA (adenosine(37)-N6)-threonylcarbamoyltransferase complex ATPase subunit type 1 TsaE, partial [Bryobacteraceae bacterium]
MQHYKTGSADETQTLGRELAASLPEQGLVLLIGNLGAGKTTLVKGIVEQRGVASADDVSSPTYTLIHPYGDPVRIYHVDLYRLDTPEEVRGIGIDDL